MTLNCSVGPQGSVKRDLAFSALIMQSIYNNGHSESHDLGDREFFMHLFGGILSQYGAT